MFTNLVLASFLPAGAFDLASDPDWSAFQQFTQDHNRVYSSESEITGRFAIFKDNLKLIDERNAKGSAKHGVNKFSDVSPEEFRRTYLNYQPTSLNLTKKEFPANMKVEAKSVNWCEQGHCTPMKDQGQCGSCWAFDGVEMLESDYSIRFGQLIELSTQQVVSCDTNDGGCGGGNAVNAWAYANQTGGVEPASFYEYTSGTTKQTGTCQNGKVLKKNRVVSACQSFWIAQGAADEDNMIVDIPLTPLSVAVAADYWQTYVSGVVTADDGCGPSSKYPIDHNVQVTGFNADATPNYYIVRNSWGTGWGNKGFIYIEAGKNVCGMAEQSAAVVTCAAAGAVSVSV